MPNEINDKAYLEPPDREADAVLKCYYCDSCVFEGDYYFQIESKNYCEDCLNDTFRKTAEKYNFVEED